MYQCDIAASAGKIFKVNVTNLGNATHMMKNAQAENAFSEACGKAICRYISIDI